MEHDLQNPGHEAKSPRSKYSQHRLESQLEGEGLRLRRGFSQKRRRKLPGWDWKPEKVPQGQHEGEENASPAAEAEAEAGASEVEFELEAPAGEYGHEEPPEEGGGVNYSEFLRAEELARHRDLLNALVAESVGKTDSQACNVAFIKTHKTASTTLAMIFVRYAKRHNKKLASFEGKFVSVVPLGLAVEQVRERGESVDVMHYHVNEGRWEGKWEDGHDMYRQILQDTKPINYITVVRSPREHFLSYYYYYLQPTNKMSIGKYFERKGKRPGGNLANPMCLEFGITDSAELEIFIERHLPNFLLVLLTEEFDESLMVLRRLMGWEMIDLTYSVMMETKKGVFRWDNQALVDVPKFDSLPQWVQDTIDVNTALDRRLHEAAVRIFEQKISEAGDIGADLLEFEELQRIVGSYLEGNKTSQARLWYASDAEPYNGGPPLYTVGLDAQKPGLAREKHKAKFRAHHEKRLEEISRRAPGTGTLDNTPPYTAHLVHLKTRPKKKAILAARDAEVERANRDLLRQMTKIFTTPSTLLPVVDSVNGRGNGLGPCLSINVLCRKRELERIALENKTWMKHLDAVTPSYDATSWERDRAANKKVMERLRTADDDGTDGIPSSVAVSVKAQEPEAPTDGGGDDSTGVRILGVGDSSEEMAAATNGAHEDDGSRSDAYSEFGDEGGEEEEEAKEDHQPSYSEFEDETKEEDDEDQYSDFEEGESKNEGTRPPFTRRDWTEDGERSGATAEPEKTQALLASLRDGGLVTQGETSQGEGDAEGEERGESWGARAQGDTRRNEDDGANVDVEGVGGHFSASSAAGQDGETPEEDVTSPDEPSQPATRQRGSAGGVNVEQKIMVGAVEDEAGGDQRGSRGTDVANGVGAGSERSNEACELEKRDNGQSNRDPGPHRDGMDDEQPETSRRGLRDSADYVKPSGGGGGGGGVEDEGAESIESSYRSGSFEGDGDTSESAMSGPAPDVGIAPAEAPAAAPSDGTSETMEADAVAIGPVPPSRTAISSSEGQPSSDVDVEGGNDDTSLPTPPLADSPLSPEDRQPPVLDPVPSMGCLHLLEKIPSPTEDASCPPPPQQLENGLADDIVIPAVSSPRASIDPVRHDQPLQEANNIAVIAAVEDTDNRAQPAFAAEPATAQQPSSQGVATADDDGEGASTGCTSGVEQPQKASNIAVIAAGEDTDTHAHSAFAAEPATAHQPSLQSAATADDDGEGAGTACTSGVEGDATPNSSLAEMEEEVNGGSAADSVGEDAITAPSAAPSASEVTSARIEPPAGARNPVSDNSRAEEPRQRSEEPPENGGESGDVSLVVNLEVAPPESSSTGEVSPGSTLPTSGLDEAVPTSAGQHQELAPTATAALSVVGGEGQSCASHKDEGEEFGPPLPSLDREESQSSSRRETPTQHGDDVIRKDGDTESGIASKEHPDTPVVPSEGEQSGRVYGQEAEAEIVTEVELPSSQGLGHGTDLEYLPQDVDNRETNSAPLDEAGQNGGDQEEAEAASESPEALLALPKEADVEDGDLRTAPAEDGMEKISGISFKTPGESTKDVTPMATSDPARDRPGAEGGLLESPSAQDVVSDFVIAGKAECGEVVGENTRTHDSVEPNVEDGQAGPTNITAVVDTPAESNAPLLSGDDHSGGDNYLRGSHASLGGIDAPIVSETLASGGDPSDAGTDPQVVVDNAQGNSSGVDETLSSISAHADVHSPSPHTEETEAAPNPEHIPSSETDLGDSYSEPSPATTPAIAEPESRAAEEATTPLTTDGEDDEHMRKSISPRGRDEEAPPADSMSESIECLTVQGEPGEPRSDPEEAGIGFASSSVENTVGQGGDRAGQGEGLVRDRARPERESNPVNELLALGDGSNESFEVFDDLSTSVEEAVEACAVRSPKWNEGSHHLMVDMSDDGRNHRPAIADSYAMEASSNMHTCFYRMGYDISISLAPEHSFHDLDRIDPWDRKFFLTTKGSVYLSGRGSEERMSLVPIHDKDHGVVISLHCFEGHGEHLLPENAEYCQSLRGSYDDYEYSELMNSTFGLVPAGRSPGTFRLGEVMSAGAIPVFVGRDIVPAFQERFDWSSFSFSFAPNEVGAYMVKTLRAVPHARLEEMQRKSLEVYLEIFGPDENDFRPSARILLDILRKRLEHRGR
eukprot:g11447.t2